MRQALGQLGTASPGRPDAAQRRPSYQAMPGTGRHRFRQDGEVPVVRVSLATSSRGTGRPAHAPVGIMAAGQGQAGEERVQGGIEAARQVQELTEQLRATLTRLGHAELALAEATRATQARQEEAAGLRRALDTAEAALAQLRAELAASERVCEDKTQRRAATLHFSQATGDLKDIVLRRKVGRPLGSFGHARREAAANEVEPVTWWVKN